MTGESGDRDSQKKQPPAESRPQRRPVSQQAVLQALIDSIPDFIFQKDRESRFLLVNRALVKVVGVNGPEEMIGKTDRDFFPREIADNFVSNDRIVFETASRQDSVEEQVVSASGRLTWMLTTKVPLLDDAGRVYGLIGIGRDITQRKELEERNRRLAVLVEQTSDAIVSFDLNRRVTSWNRAAERLFGYTEQEMIGAVTSLLIPPELEDEARLMRERAIRDETVSRYETTRLHKNGSRIAVSLSLSAIRDAEGNVLGWATVTRDITDRKQTEQKLKESEVRYRSLFESTQEGVALHRLICNDEGRAIDYEIVDVNPAYTQQTGVLAEVARGSRASVLYGAGEAPYLERYAPVARGGGSISFETYFAPLGRHFQISVFSPKMGYFATVFADITERKFREGVQDLMGRFIVDADTPGDFRATIRRITQGLQEWSGFEAVGLRLRDGEDYPYYETCGFPPAFVEHERRLCAHDSDGTVLRDDSGSPVLECMCGNILCGRFDPAKPFFTAHGSFYANSTTALLASTTEVDRQARTRNRCNGEGYESVALIPLRAGDQVFGLLQFNDHRKDRITSKWITHVEQMADTLAIVLSRRSVEEKLKADEKKYRDLFSEMGQGFAVIELVLTDSDRPIDYATLEINKAFERMLETRREDVVGRLASESLPPAELKSWLGIFGRVGLDGIPEHYEQYSPVNGKYFRGYAYSPRRKQVAVIFEDISDRKKIEDKLRESEERYRSIVENAYDAILLTEEGGTGTILSANSAACRMFGQTEAELCAVGRNSIADPSDPRLLHALEVRARTGSFHGELTLVRSDGSRFPAEVRSSVFFERGGRKLTSMIVHDLSPEVAAREQISFQAGLLQKVSQAVIATDLAGHILFWNGAATDLYGWTEREALGELISKLITPAGARHEAEQQFADLARGDGRTSETLVCDKRGRVFPVQVSTSPIMDESGNQVGIVGLSYDLTERKQAAEEQQKLQAQLQHAQKMESVGRLAGGVAHDFNNMLGLILGHAEMALQQIDSSHLLHNALEEIYKAAERSAVLTRQLLAFARKQTIAPRVIDLNQTVGGMIAMLRRLIGENVQLVWKPSADLWPIKMDPSQIDQILTNLCVNARDAIADVGTITIETDTTVIEEVEDADHPTVRGEHVVLVVQDSGSGMDTETQSHLFEPFFTTKEVGKGTGLGLATVYGIVKQNEGSIHVQSAPNQGTKVSIYLPRCVERVERAAQGEVAARSLRGEETILVVEDEASSLKLIKRMIEQQGYTVLAAGSPAEAIRIAQERAGEIHLLMTDVVMPEMNGRELAKSLLSLHPRLKCLFMSGFTADVIAEHGVLERGMQFIQKPFSSKSLGAKVRETLDN